MLSPAKLREGKYFQSVSRFVRGGTKCIGHDVLDITVHGAPLYGGLLALGDIWYPRLEAC